VTIQGQNVDGKEQKEAHLDEVKSILQAIR